MDSGLRRPPRGGVDRNSCRTQTAARVTEEVAPLAGAWIETSAARRREDYRPKSPPSRGRGSKPTNIERRERQRLSPPSRGRGSKLTPGDRLPDRVRSRPPRGGVDRNSPGVRRRPGSSSGEYVVVAPLGGRFPDQNGAIVAPLAGAWIETVIGQRRRMNCPPRVGRRNSVVNSIRTQPVAPSRGRGSKQSPHQVAPLAGAWIETFRGVGDVLVAGRPPRGGVDRNQRLLHRRWCVAWSPPSRGRGKRAQGREHPRLARSPPSRGRGSKPQRMGLSERRRRPPRGGVDRNNMWSCWFARCPIETPADRHARATVAPLAGAWIRARHDAVKVAPLAGAWIETIPTMAPPR